MSVGHFHLFKYSYIFSKYVVTEKTDLHLMAFYGWLVKVLKGLLALPRWHVNPTQMLKEKIILTLLLNSSSRLLQEVQLCCTRGERSGSTLNTRTVGIYSQGAEWGCQWMENYLKGNFRGRGILAQPTQEDCCWRQAKDLDITVVGCWLNDLIRECG